MSRYSTLAFALLAITSGCFASDSAAGGDSFQDDDIPMGGCDTETSTGGECHAGTATDGQANGGSCDATNQCSGESVCAAPFNDGEVGDLVCQAACIGNDDDTRWCSDDASCCDANASCSPRGLCQLGTADDTTGSSDDAGGSSDGGSTGADGSTGVAESTSGSESDGSSESTSL